MTWNGVAASPPRLDAWWDAVRSRLDTAALEAWTIPSEYVSASPADDVALSWRELPRGDDDAQWGRLVIVPVVTAFPVEEDPARGRHATFLVRSDVNIPSVNADPFPALELMQRHAFDRLHGWLPSGVADTVIRLRVWRSEPPQPFPQLRPETGLHYLSSEFRAFLESPDAPAAP